jgi:NadR type nicotinamide-nucleotide adenylyltransferase
MREIKKVVVIGPESTGKSTLCKLLAAHYQTIWCAEYAREYLLNNGIDYTFEDLLTIARGQLLLQGEAEQKVIDNALPYNIVYPKLTNSQLLFIDTDMYVMKVWCEYVFGKCHQFILDEIVKQRYDLYLLCKPDIDWVKDELREYPDEKVRIELYHIYRDILINQSVPWAEVSGDYEERLRMGVKAVEEIMEQQR